MSFLGILQAGPVLSLEYSLSAFRSLPVGVSGALAWVTERVPSCQTDDSTPPIVQARDPFLHPLRRDHNVMTRNS